MSCDTLIILCLLTYVTSFGVLLLRGRAHGTVAFLYLFWLHLIIGFGYVFFLAYEHWSWGEAYIGLEQIAFSKPTYVAVFLLCLCLSALTICLVRLPPRAEQELRLEQRPLGAADWVLVAVMLAVYAAGILMGTLRVGIGPTYSLPFRLNGLIEATTLFLLPFYLSVRSLVRPQGFWIAFALIVAYAVANLACFGSKYAALYPIVVFITIQLAMDRRALRRVVLPALAIVMFYAVLNPFYFRRELKEGTSSSMAEMVHESIKSAKEATGGAGEQALHGIRNLAHRVTGVVPLQIAIDDLEMSEGGILPAKLRLRVNEYYNDTIHYSICSTSYAPGFLGFFVFMFSNYVLGVLAGLLALAGLFRVAVWIDARSSYPYNPVFGLAGVSGVLMTFPFLIDGLFDKISGYCQLVFVVVAVRYLLSFVVIPVPRPVKVSGLPSR